MSHPTKCGDAARLRALKSAYRTADENREDVILITTSAPKYECDEWLPYWVLVSQASAWELANGERVQWRER